MKVVVAGGGIAGLASAIGLAKKGLQVLILEQKPELSEEGAGIQLGPNAAKALMALGVWDRLQPHLTALKHIEIGNGLGGRVLCRFPLDDNFRARFGAPYSVVHRADLLSELAATAKGFPTVEIATGTQVASISRFDRPVVRLMDGTEIEAEALIGADGFRSLVRSSLLGEDEPRKWGENVYRAVLEANAAPGVPLDAVCLWLLPGAHIVHYPLRGGRLMNVVVVCKGIGGSRSAPSHPERPGIPRCSEQLAALIAAPDTWRVWAATDRDPSLRWSVDRVTLIGDAAHPSLPYLAQGAAMALEDAVVLASELAAMYDPESAFRAYEADRQLRTARIIREARRQGRIDHLGPPLSYVRDAVLRVLPGAALLHRLDWIYGWSPEPEET